MMTTLPDAGVLDVHQNRLRARWREAHETAQSMRRGECDETTLARWALEYFDGARRRSPADIVAIATQNRADHLAETGFAALESWRIAMERPALTRMRLLFAIVTDPLAKSANRPDAAATDAAIETYFEAIEAIESCALPVPRDDLKAAHFAAVKTSMSAPYRAVADFESAWRRHRHAYLRESGNAAQMVNTITRLHESEMACAWLCARAWSALRGIVPPPVRMDRMLRRVGRESARALKDLDPLLARMDRNRLLYAACAARPANENGSGFNSPAPPLC